MKHQVTFDPPYLQLDFEPYGSYERPWIFRGEHRYENTVMRFVVPDGVRCDLASVPRLARLWCDPNGPWQRAAAFHDAAYRLQTCTRFQADAMFRAIMEHDGIGRMRILAMYYAVRIFGFAAWQANQVVKDRT